MINKGQDLVWKAILETANITAAPTITSISLEYKTMFAVAEFHPITFYLLSSSIVLITFVYVTLK